jgi:cysteine desulfurase
MKIRDKIYLDHNATTPVDRRVLEAMLPYFGERFGNASSSTHVFGWDADEAVDLARTQVAELIGASRGEVYFTSGATESISLAIKGICEGGASGKTHIITCATEHAAVLDTCRYLEGRGVEVTYLRASPSGEISLELLADAITAQTRLVCLMHANNETGVIHPLAGIARIAAAQGVLLMTDATQSAGKIPLDVHEMGVDLAVFSAHKLYGPKGVGALYVRRGLQKQLQPQVFGGGQEKHLRPGTLNVPGIVGMGKACEICAHEREAEARRLAGLRGLLESELLTISGVHVNGQEAPRLPHTSNLWFEGIDGSKLVRALPGLALSRGAACSSVTTEPSHVLKAMGLSDEQALAALRMGLGRFSTEADVREAIASIRSAILALRKHS